MEVEKIVYVERSTEDKTSSVPPSEKIVEKIVYVEVPVERIVEVVVEKPVPGEIIHDVCEKIVYVDKIV